MKPVQIALIAVIIVIAVVAVFFLTQQNVHGMLGDVHIHADFKVYLDGVEYNFSEEKYISTENHTLSPFLHLHNMDGNVIHQHISGVNLGDFFRTLKMTFNSSCFRLDNGTSYCNTQDKTLKMYVKPYNGQWTRNYDFDAYQFQDMDKILITYGSDSQIQAQMGSVTDRACMYSNKCPEKGTLNVNESGCVGGTGTGCTAVQLR